MSVHGSSVTVLVADAASARIRISIASYRQRWQRLDRNLIFARRATQGEETLLDALEGLAADPSLGAIVLVTHHLEEIPRGFTHALVLAHGAPVAAGGIDEALGSAPLGAAYGLPLEVERRAGRFTARRARS